MLNAKFFESFDVNALNGCIYTTHYSRLKVQKRWKREMGEKRENELTGFIHYFIELYVKIKIEMLWEL